MKNFSHNTNKSLFRVALAAAAVTAALTGAVRADEVPQIHVKYADLNINSSAGAQVLYRRIRVAADRVCEISGSRDLAAWAKERECARHAIAQAVSDVGNPTLTRVYEDKTGVSPTETALASR
jgi:UrcA family protein